MKKIIFTVLTPFVLVLGLFNFFLFEDPRILRQKESDKKTRKEVLL